MSYLCVVVVFSIETPRPQTFLLVSSPFPTCSLVLLDSAANPPTASGPLDSLNVVCDILTKQRRLENYTAANRLIIGILLCNRQGGSARVCLCAHSGLGSKRCRQTGGSRWIGGNIMTLLSVLTSPLRARKEKLVEKYSEMVRWFAVLFFFCSKIKIRETTKKNQPASFANESIALTRARP